MAKKFSRRQAGSMLVLVIAFIFLILCLAVVMGLGFVRLVGTNTEQRTAIEAAAIAVARDLSAIVVNTPECGFVSLSDYAPVGTATQNGDGFAMPVRSINTLIGTARLDLIVGDLMDQDVMRELAKRDMQDALSAKDQLLNVLAASMAPGGSATDKDGNAITPYVDAENAYRNNQIRMTGASNYVPNSMVLALGSIQGGLSTAIPVPKPASTAPVPSSQQVNGFYKSFVNIPYGGVDFVFGGIGPNVKIVDYRNWVATIPSLPYQMQTIVRAEAVQHMTDPYNPNGYDVKAVACAQPASVHDPLPQPGALSISFPDGAVPEIRSPRDVYENTDLKGGVVDLLTAKAGDYPTDPGSNMAPTSWPVASALNTSNAWLTGLHDWIRRAGTKADIDSIINMQTTPLDSASPSTAAWVAPVVQGGPYLNIGTVPAGIIHIYKFDMDGVVTYQSRLLTPYPLYVSSNEQMYAETMMAIPNSSVPIQTYSVPLPDGNKDIQLMKRWDVYIRDEVRNPGSIRGGKHGGEPLAKPLVVKSLSSADRTTMLLQKRGAY